MFKEWIVILSRYFQRANKVLAKDINGTDFSRKSLLASRLVFWVIALVIVCFLPQGLNDLFIEYIKDIFAIFVGFFVTVLCFVFDKLDTKSIPSSEEEDEKLATERSNSQEKVKIKQEHNYTVRFFYTIGLIILFSTAVIILLIPNIFWNTWFNEDIREYEFVGSVNSLTWESVGTFVHLTLCVVYRVVIILMTMKVFYYTTYCVSSLLQTLIKKKELTVWY